MKTLLVEEDAALGEAIAQSLRARGHEVEWVTTGASSYTHCDGDRYDFILLSGKLSDASGIDILKWLRKRNIETPVLVVTAWLNIDQKIRLLDAGADDYMVKPFDLRELEARMRALNRRYSDISSCKEEFGDVIMDAAARSISVGGKHVSLSKREFRLFEILTSRLNQVVPKERLMDQLFGYAEDVGPNAIELYVSRVRQKLRASKLRIETIRSVGYVARVFDCESDRRSSQESL
jgi:two-component system, OmpR family, response regulator TctD